MYVWIVAPRRCAHDSVKIECEVPAIITQILTQTQTRTRTLILILILIPILVLIYRHDTPASSDAERQ